jgi:molybdenum cofactor cytidylyltransferase
MKFGSVDIHDESLMGSILAHTLRLGNGAGAVKKGVVLSEREIARLRHAGYEEVTVAQLEPTDVHEDQAAQRLAGALADPSLVAFDASTGRCNLHAAYSGLVWLDPEKISAANRICESITVATLPAYSRVPAKAMVATIKVIPFAVSKADLERWTAALGTGAALRVAGYSRFDAGLVLTELPGMSQSLSDRASRTQRIRLRSLGSRVRREVRCRHDVEAVTRAIRTLSQEGCNPIMLLGASAIVDRGDIIPRALCEAGGEVLHLGMPVDPGNLLMVGSLGDKTVLGLPGCARSLDRGGFDLVLDRFCIGEGVDSALISSLGVGGLLREIPDRPMPRGLASQKGVEKQVVAVVLAAGQSCRMGQVNKLTMPVEGTPMVARVVDALADSAIARTIVVTGHAPDEIRDALCDRDVEFVHNPDYREGMSTSIRAGISALGGEADAALVALADMPWVGPQIIDRLVNAFSPSADVGIYVPLFKGERGNPVLWGSQHFAELCELSGDIGAKALFRLHPAALCYVDVEGIGVTIDVDTPDALEAGAAAANVGESTKSKRGFRFRR